MEQSLKHAKTFLKRLDKNAVGPTTTNHVLRQRLARRFPDVGVAPEQVIDDLVTDTEGGLLSSTGGRFFGWVIGGAHPAGIAADWLTTVWDQNAAIAACSPAAAIVEEVCGDWLKDILRLPKKASFGLVTGCQSAHITALAAARHQLLQNRRWDVELNGLSGAPKIHLITSEARHESLVRAIRILGIGTNAVRLVPCENNGSISLKGLKGALSESDFPTIVCLQAGDLNTGAFDPFEEAISMAREKGAWVHIDGAFGLWASASGRYSHLLKGFEKADSWATDGHKWLNVPFDSGFVFVADPASHSSALNQPASYSIPTQGVRDQMNWNPEWSRRARGFAVYAVLRSMGRKGIESLVDRCCAFTDQIVQEIGKMEGAEILASPIINQGLVRFLDDDGGHDALTDRVISQIQKDGRTWFGPATWRGKRVMRVSVCNWRTSNEDVNTALNAVRDCLSLVRDKSN